MRSRRRRRRKPENDDFNTTQHLFVALPGVSHHGGRAQSKESRCTCIDTTVTATL